MADVVFPTYPFRSSTDTTRALRTPRERIHDEISVLEFGSIATPSACRATIQAAFDSAEPALYFPKGEYLIDGPIIIPNDSSHRVIRGAGPHSFDGGASGTGIRASNVSGFGGFRDYLWKTQQIYSPGLPISSISGMSFANGHRIGTGFDTTLITQVDPPSASPYAGNGMGCLFLQISWMSVHNCWFFNTCGVGLYFPGINNHCSTFLASGGFDGDVNDTFCVGIWGSSCVITSGKVVGYRVGVAVHQGPSFLAEMDIELCQWGIMTTNPLTLWDRNDSDDPIKGVGSQTVGMCNIQAMNFEQCASKFEGGGALYAAGGLSVDGLSHTGGPQVGTASHHIKLVGAYGSFRNVSVAGVVTVCGIGTDDRTYDTTWTQCQSGTSTSGMPEWSLNRKPDNVGGNTNVEQAGQNGHHFISCSTSSPINSGPYVGAILFHQLPMSNPINYNVQVISDCTMPNITYSGATSVSNSGKTVLTTVGDAHGGGTNTTRLICRPIVKLAATANWAAPVGGFPGTGTNTITMTANPSDVVQPGMMVWKGNSYVGKVLTFVGTVLTLDVNPNIAPGTGDNRAAVGGSAGDILTFSCWTVA